MNEIVIEAEQLGKDYGDVVALDDVDLRVPYGTVLGLLGPNGAGKTTAIRILTTNLAPSRGRARVLGVDVTKNPQAVREQIGLAGQFAAVDDNLTGRENLRLIGYLTHQPRKAVGARADELLEQFGLTDAANRPAKTYSGGMRRRLDLAASLVHRPPVLFLDEPTTGLDPASRTDLWGVIEGLVAGGTTLLLTTQYLEEADRLADRVMVIDGGKTIAEGTPTELKTHFGATVVEITLPDENVERAMALLAPLGATEHLEGTTVGVTIADAGRGALEVVRALDREQLVPDRLVVREPSLDDVFLKLTGHRAEDDAGPGASSDAGVDPERGVA
ncbi:MAG: ATP-binding cassette domain-containing protein [Acidimicrobiia bacterium]